MVVGGGGGAGAYGRRDPRRDGLISLRGAGSMRSDATRVEEISQNSPFQSRQGMYP